MHSHLKHATSYSSHLNSWRGVNEIQTEAVAPTCFFWNTLWCTLHVLGQLMCLNMAKARTIQYRVQNQQRTNRTQPNNKTDHPQTRRRIRGREERKKIGIQFLLLRTDTQCSNYQCNVPGILHFRNSNTVKISSTHCAVSCVCFSASEKKKRTSLLTYIVC